MSVLLCSEIFKRATPIGKVRKIVGIESLPVRAAICTEGGRRRRDNLTQKKGDCEQSITNDVCGM